MARRVILHVGTPKTGTSYLQDVLFRNRRRLPTRGLSYPADRPDAHFLAGLDLMQLPWGGLENEAVGAWEELARAVRRWPGTSIVSHEILAAASRPQAERALESLGLGAGAEVHLVLSVRDLTRQIPAEWQENLKHRSALSYRDFLDQIQDPARSGRVASWFWSVQELPAILDRWAAHLPADRVHLVTVPPSGADPDLLWQRFVSVFRLGGLPLDLAGERANPSLGVPETALLRRLNQAVTRDLPPADYRPLVRELLAHRTLSQRTGSPRLALPPQVRPWAEGLMASWVAELGARGYDVVGDLADLAPTPAADDYVDPDRVPERQIAAVALDALRALLLESARMRHEEELAREELHHSREALDRAYLRPSYRLREKAVSALERGAVGRRALGVYRWARGRSSRSA
ncbi:MAG: hypothetical protein R2731_00455 [Nocardioides sp.]